MISTQQHANLSSLTAQIGSVITQTYRRVTYGSLTQRITIQPGEVQRIAVGYHTLQIIAGSAWLTQCGDDITLEPGQQMQLTHDRDGVLVSALHHQPVVLDLR